jgi:tungstate transport system substrate-binding protein
MRKAGLLPILVVAVLVAVAVIAEAQQPTKVPRDPKDKDVILSTTTSTQDSGLLNELIPLFEKQSGYRMKTVAVGTGQALAMAAKGEADVVLVHAPSLEKQCVA